MWRKLVDYQSFVTTFRVAGLADILPTAIGKPAETNYICLDEIKFRWILDTGLIDPKPGGSRRDRIIYTESDRIVATPNRPITPVSGRWIQDLRSQKLWV